MYFIAQGKILKDKDTTQPGTKIYKITYNFLIFYNNLNNMGL